MFFGTILRQFIVSVNNQFSGLFFSKQKGTRVFQLQEDNNVVIIITLSSTKTCLNFLIFYFLANEFGETSNMSMKSTSFTKEL